MSKAQFKSLDASMAVMQKSLKNAQKNFDGLKETFASFSNTKDGVSDSSSSEDD